MPLSVGTMVGVAVGDAVALREGETEGVADNVGVGEAEGVLEGVGVGEGVAWSLRSKRNS